MKPSIMTLLNNYNLVPAVVNQKQCWTSYSCSNTPLMSPHHTPVPISPPPSRHGSVDQLGPLEANETSKLEINHNLMSKSNQSSSSSPSMPPLSSMPPSPKLLDNKLNLAKAPLNPYTTSIPFRDPLEPLEPLDPIHPPTRRHHFRRSSVAIKFSSLPNTDNDTVKIDVLNSDAPHPKFWRRSSYHQINNIKNHGNYINYNSINDQDTPTTTTTSPKSDRSTLPRSYSTPTTSNFHSENYNHDQLVDNRSNTSKCVLKGDFGFWSLVLDP